MATVSVEIPGARYDVLVVPGLLVTALIALPYIDRKRHGVGVWFSRERKVAITIFSACLSAAIVLTVIGTAFRGPASS